jgi:hypothetical protein
LPKLLGTLASGEQAVDGCPSHLHGRVIHYLPEALGQIDARGRAHIAETIDLGRVVGERTCVATEPGDEIVCAQRPGRAGLTRWVKNRRPEPCTTVMVVVAQEPAGYVCLTAFVGGGSEPEPWDFRATSRSMEFWQTHALIWGEEPAIPGTETPDCPW